MSRPRWLVVGALGIAQILAWGMSYYLIAVLAKPIDDATGWGLTWVVGGLSIGFLVSGLVSPRVGRLIDRFGGRPVLVASALLLAAGLLVLAAAPNIAVYVAGWCILGVAMGAGLYDPAFATLGRIYGENARSAITLLTLYGGFASTVCWPLSALLVDQVGWRGACLAYAAIALFVMLPLYAFFLPREAESPPPAKGSAPAGAVAITPRLRVGFWLVAINFTGASILMTIVSVHVLTLLQARGLEVAVAVLLGTLIGPAQVGARVIEALIGRRFHPVWTLVASNVFAAGGLGLMFGDPSLAAIGLILYGCGSGIRSIARGTLPLAMFGREGYPTLMGRLAMPALLAQAASPSLGALLIEHLGADATLRILAIAAVVTIAASLPLLAFRRPA
jgi:predicted MFS family arabinose efflux permease